MLRVILCFFTVLSSLISFAQHRCGTVEYEKLLQQKRPSRETSAQFESWMQGKIAKHQKKSGVNAMSSTIYAVPVVVHIIHNGESVGTGLNISDAQILSQIKVLNDDFQRLNADSVKTLNEFLPVAGKFKVEFVLAKQDPNGYASNGIVRVQGTQSSWGMSDNYTLKAQSYWPAEEYLNIWVTRLTGGLLGYTQFPSSSTLQGLDDNSIDRLTDGVVIDSQTFGTINDPLGSTFDLISGYNLGRTVTHEVGHFFGLRHVWGDVYTCNPNYSTDFVDDTPIQDTDFNGTCPSGTRIDCSGSAMYANYMNYTDDACMNLFSKGQVSRMDIVINNSPRRLSLLTSLGSQAPAPVANDIQLKALVTPATTACYGNVSPALLLRNFGTNDITSSQIQFFVNGNSTETKLFSLALAPNAETTVYFSPIPLTAGATYEFSFQVMQTNNVADGRFYNDTIAHTFTVPQPVTLPSFQPFNLMPANWTIQNPDGLDTWKNVAVSGHGHAMAMEFYNYDNKNATDLLITPVLDLTTATVASLSFDYAYSAYGGSHDRLRILVSTSCDFSSSPTEIFNKAGSDLSSTDKDPNGDFVPTSSDWATSIISLNQFIGQKIQIAFVGTNEWGNNLYLDNVTILNYPVSSFAINNLVSPSPVSCLPSVSPVISIKNLGNMMIDSFTVDTYVNDSPETQLFSNAQIEIGTSKTFALSPITLLSGGNSLSIVIKSPNGSAGAASKDSLATQRYLNTSSEVIPFRQNFDKDSLGWTSMSPDFGLSWKRYTTNKGKSMILNAFATSGANRNKQAWLVSPVMDFSNVQKASVFFETSYAYNPPGEEILQVFYSTDCGQNFDQQLYIKSGFELKNAFQNTAWAPVQDDQWSIPKQFINLDPLAGKKNVRLAFVATNDNGNNLFIDNIEFFADDNESTVAITSEYAVYGGMGATNVEVTFNLPERQMVRMQVYDIMGHVIIDQMLPDTLNQTYTLESALYSKGIYFIRIQTQNSTTTTKVFFGH